MNRPAFGEGVLAALLLSLAGSIGFYALTFVFSTDAAIRLIVCALAFTYVLYLFGRSPERVGRVTATAVGGMAAAGLWGCGTPLAVFLLFHAFYAGLIRCLYFHNRIATSLADLGLCLFGLAPAFWALQHSGSLFLALWCYFLSQALFALLPAGNLDKADSGNDPDPFNADFERAHRAAEAAVRKLSTSN